MSLNEEVDALRRVPLFAKMDPTKLKLLAFTSEKLEYQSGQDLCTQGDTGDAMFIIMTGEADVIVNTPSGERTVAHLGKNRQKIKEKLDQYRQKATGKYSAELLVKMLEKEMKKSDE